jgi:nitroreductase
MLVSEVLRQRVSTRAFLPEPVPAERLHNLFELAQLAPSNCNVQPWQVYVASGAVRDELSRRLLAEAGSGAVPAPEVPWGLSGYQGVYRERQFGSANALYGALGIDRRDRPARTEAALRNWAFFDAPHAAFFTMHKDMGLQGAVDLGIYAQGLVLLMAEQNIASCYQGALNHYPGPVRELLDIPSDYLIVFGLSFGYADPAAPVNRARTEREPLANAVHFVG